MAMCHIINQSHDSISAYLYGHPLLPGLVAVHVDVPLQVELGGEALATAEVEKIFSRHFQEDDGQCQIS